MKTIDMMERFSKKKDLIVKKSLYKKKIIKEANELSDDSEGVRKSNIPLKNSSDEKTKNIKIYMHLDYLDGILETSLSFGLQPVIDRTLLAQHIVNQVKDSAEINDMVVPPAHYKSLEKLLSSNNVYNKPAKAELITNEILKKIFGNTSMFSDDGNDEEEYEPSDKEIMAADDEFDKELSLKEFNKTIKRINHGISEKKVSFDKSGKFNSIKFIELCRETIYDIIVEFQDKFSIFNIKRKLPKVISNYEIDKNTVLYLGDQNSDTDYFNPFNKNLNFAVRIPLIYDTDNESSDITSIQNIGKINLELTKKLTKIFSEIGSELVSVLFSEIPEKLEYITKFNGTLPADTKL